MPTLEQHTEQQPELTPAEKDASRIATFIEFEERAKELNATEDITGLVIFARDYFSKHNAMDEFDDYISESLITTLEPEFQNPENLAESMQQDLDARLIKFESFIGYMNLFVKIDEVNE